MSEALTVLLLAAGRGDLAKVRRLIEDGLSVDAKNHIGGTTLMSSCASYQVEVVRFLLELGADVNIRTKDGRTALHAAVGSTPSMPERQRECVQLLLEHGALVDCRDETGVTPLMNAAWFGSLPSVLELLRSGADPSRPDAKGRTALDLALLKNRDDIAKAIKANQK